MANTYTIGSLVTLTATFIQTSNETAINPSSVIFTVRKPDGTQSTPSPSNPTTGTYTAQVSIDQQGTWRWRASGTGTAQAQADSYFIVQPNTF